MLTDTLQQKSDCEQCGAAQQELHAYGVLAESSPLVSDAPAASTDFMLCTNCGSTELSAVLLEIDSLWDEQPSALRVLRCFSCGEGLVDEDALRSALSVPRESSRQDESRQQTFASTGSAANDD